MSPLAMRSLHSYCILHVNETMTIEQGNRAHGTIENVLIEPLQVVIGQRAWSHRNGGAARTLSITSITSSDACSGWGASQRVGLGSIYIVGTALEQGDSVTLVIIATIDQTA